MYIASIHVFGGKLEKLYNASKRLLFGSQFVNSPKNDQNTQVGGKFLQNFIFQVGMDLKNYRNKAITHVKACKKTTLLYRKTVQKQDKKTTLQQVPGRLPVYLPHLFFLFYHLSTIGWSSCVCFHPSLISALFTSLLYHYLKLIYAETLPSSTVYTYTYMVA